MIRKYLSYIAAAWFLAGWTMHSSAQDSEVEPLISYSQLHPLLPENSTPMVRVFDSGVVEVNRLPGYKRPGSYKLTIGAEQIAQIKNLLNNSSEVNFEVYQIASASSAATSENGERTLTIETDPTTTVVKVNTALLANTEFTSTESAIQTLTVESLAEVAETSNSPAIDSMRELEVLLLNLYESAGN